MPSMTIILRFAVVILSFIAFDIYFLPSILSLETESKNTNIEKYTNPISLGLIIIVCLIGIYLYPSGAIILVFLIGVIVYLCKLKQ